MDKDILQIVHMFICYGKNHRKAVAENILHTYVWKLVVMWFPAKLIREVQIMFLVYRLHSIPEILQCKSPKNISLDP